MSRGLLDEYEVMLNTGLGAETLYAYTAAFNKVRERQEDAVTLWHLATVLPLVFHEVSRRAITKRRPSSGLRAILARNPEHNIAQNEAVFNLNRRVRAMFPRTIRSLNCAIAWGLLRVEDGALLPCSSRPSSSLAGEVREIVKAAEKLGMWSAQVTAFEYFTVLGVEFHE